MIEERMPQRCPLCILHPSFVPVPSALFPSCFGSNCILIVLSLASAGEQGLLPLTS